MFTFEALKVWHVHFHVINNRTSLVKLFAYSFILSVPVNLSTDFTTV